MKRDAENVESAEQWDYATVQRRPGVTGGRAVVSVSFRRDEFDLIARCAEQKHERVSEFIRNAALQRCSSHAESADITYGGGAVSGTIEVPALPPRTAVLGAEGVRVEESVGATS